MLSLLGTRRFCLCVPDIRVLYGSVTFLLVILSLGCGSIPQQSNTASSNAKIHVAISPGSVTLPPNAKLQFTARELGATHSLVTWTSKLGRISEDGAFTAPAVDRPTKIEVVASSAADPSRQSTAMVTVEPGSAGRGKSGNSGSKKPLKAPVPAPPVSPEPPGSSPISAPTTAPAPGPIPVPPTGGDCGPPYYYCSRTDAAEIIPSSIPQLGANPNYYGGHGGRGMVAIDPAYNNRILRVTDGNVDRGNGVSFNTAASAERNISSFDESLFIAHEEGNALCLFSFDQSEFQSTLRGCFHGVGGGAGANFGYTQADNHAIYNYQESKLYRFIVDTTNWTISPDPSFNHGQGYFDADNPRCLNGQIAANHWNVQDRALSSDDNTLIAAVGPSQDNGAYFVVWDAAKGCQWLNVQTWQVSNGWDTGLSNPVAISWVGDIKATSPGGIHNAQIDRSGAYGVLAVHHDGIGHKMFWTIGTNIVDATCAQCQSHWACDFGVCFWNHQQNSSFGMVDRAIGSSVTSLNMDNISAVGVTGNEEHASHANAEPGVRNIYLTSWEPSGGGSTISGVWEDEIIGISWDGSQRSIRFNKHWNSGYGFWATARCSISRHGHYALCGSDYQMYNLDKGFGNGLNQDTCDHRLPPAVHGTNGCRTDVLLFELR